MCKYSGVARGSPDARAGNSIMQKLQQEREICKIFQNPARVDIVGQQDSAGGQEMVAGSHGKISLRRNRTIERGTVFYVVVVIVHKKNLIP